MSLPYALDLATKALDAKKETTEYLAPYLKEWFEHQPELDRFFDPTEAECKYVFQDANDQHFIFWTDDWTDRYGDWQGSHTVYVPYRFVQNSAEYLRVERERIADRNAREAAIDRANSERRINILRRQLEAEEAKLAKSSGDPIAQTATQNSITKLQEEINA